MGSASARVIRGFAIPRYPGRYIARPYTLERSSRLFKGILVLLTAHRWSRHLGWILLQRRLKEAGLNTRKGFLS
jgi:hypothetical protein